MKSRLAIVIVLCFVVGLTQAQDYAFKVLVNKGKNELKTGSSWQPLKVGLSLKAADELKVSENSYLGLVHVSGKALELKQSGNYKVTDLAAKISGGSSVVVKYTEFILSTTATSKNRLAATGAVDRGTGDLQVYLPSENQVVYNNHVIIQWDSEKVAGPYVITFKSMFEDELDKRESATNNLSINLNDPIFSNEDNIIVQVASKADKNKVSKAYTLKRLSKADRERIKTSLTEISNPTAEENALNKLLVAGFYEQNNLLIDASTAYLEAINLAPDVPQYKESYNDFVLRNGLKKLPPKK
jgi:hypothetical protein